MAFLPAFDTYPKEAAHIGRMLAGYGELEFDLCTCLGVVLNDNNAALRALFRSRGEEGRILIADALMRQKYATVELNDHYDTMLGAIRYCKKVRNQYAHCHWYGDPKDGLFFMDLEDAADSSALTTPLISFYHVDAPLLDRQEKYFWYTSGILQFLWREYKKRVGTLTNHDFQMPEALERPPLHNPQELHPIPASLRKGAVAPPDTAPEKGLT